MKFVYILLTIFITYTPQISANSTHHIILKKMHWPFDGMLGSFDRRSAQRGFQVYREVCAACHGLEHVSYRNLKSLGFSDDEIKAIASSVTVVDGPNDKGDNFERQGILSDNFVKPYPNEQAARAANNGAFPVDLSLITKARVDGPDYIYSLLTGYVATPGNFHLNPGLYYNQYFHQYQIAMPPPLSDGIVQYSDGTVASVEQMARDVVIFLQWAAEPEMEHRKSLGLKSMIFLLAFTVIFYIAKKRIWSKLKD